ncbi:hypothetical protein [Odoribacter sp. AF15-53]|uniref:hypothetical protein n=1 Tax=Odoribacter sp. AF15-53 TaxID=2292236 RepID=UPI000FEFB21D|nr:hypothetical protein [Odoribacter sp. AF15-53]RHR82606.1 hypothetical protein DWW52_01680 [Odoribacter sp. AF15-53]
MKWILRVISIVFFTVCFGRQVMPEGMAVERRIDVIENSMNVSEVTATFSANALAAVYDFLEKAFFLADQIDLPGDVGVQREKRGTSTKEFTEQGINGGICHLAWRDEIFDYLSVKHIQGFYIYGINKVII